MKRKCPVCSKVLSKNDIYCSQCGTKLPDTVEIETFKENNSGISNFFGKIFNFKSDGIFSYLSSNKNSSFDSFLINFLVCSIVVSIIFAVILFNIYGKHFSNKQSLQFNNYVQNPERIPELKEPKSFEEFSENIYNVEDFLELFLKYTKEPESKKEQLFISYLNEMNKLTHVTTDVASSDFAVCNKIDSTHMAKNCASKLNKLFSKTGVSAQYENRTVYLFPNYNNIKKKYSKYLSKDINNYLALRAKYDYPIVSGVSLNIEPKNLVDKLLDFEKLYYKTNSDFIKDDIEETLFTDFRQLIFNPSVYATTTHEISPQFKSAYKYLIKHKNSLFVPITMSCLEKGRAYSEENFKNDYPYKFFVDSFETNISNSNFNDIFAQLRKNIVYSGNDSKFSYIFSLKNNVWSLYSSETVIGAGDYVVSEPDKNNNVSIYNNTFSLVDEVNVSKYSQLFIANGQLYVFNKGRLQISKMFFNGRTFSLRLLSNTDVSSLFPGFEVINIDSYSNYNIYLEKFNSNANYIILSRYSNGYENYVLSSNSPNYKQLRLPVMFSISGSDDVNVSFHNSSVDPDRTSDSSPTYKFIIHTQGQPQKRQNSDNYDMYDEQTKNEAENGEKYMPNIIPKLNSEKETKKNEDNIDEKLLTLPPTQVIYDSKSEDE